MTRFIVILALLICLIDTSKGQGTEDHLDSLVDSFAKELKDEGIIRSGFAKNYCVGAFDPWDSEEGRCDYKTIYFTVYFFWQKDKTTFVKKFDNCGPYNQVRISDTSFLGFYYSNRGLIRSEWVKDFQTTEIQGKDTSIVTLHVDHSCHWDLAVYDNGELVSKHVNKFFLIPTLILGSSYVNINYLYNEALKTTQWMNLTEELIAQINQEVEFERRD